ncbi:MULTISPECIES: polysaccharide lyase family 7 protein [unclassified Vibrio]|uniref:Polysaccharide lyase family 7 protein n=1 Tax=Vibrio sp. HB236076 TaxID=3232307 RepID=A0AB39HCN6_9VIBR|nr:polysaccharide lyase family 7 protein [Vibrio sp. HB161653]MDP5255355.1 polysaccharide lyase family 7 protein [Vibrio sp. HB161653]
MKTQFALALALPISICSSLALADSAPYDIARYQSVLDESKLQAPNSATYIANGDFEGQYNQYFYVPDTGNAWMTFEVTGDHARSELRQVNNWYTSDTQYLNKMIANVLVDDPLTGEVDEITFLQVHDVTSNSNAINLPLVRIVWMREYDDVSDHYWAIIKEDACESCKNYAKIDLGEYRDSAVKFEIRIENNALTIKRDSVTHSEINKLDISYWGELESYFKAGVYNQDSGTGRVQFESLKYYQQAID